MGIPLSPRLNEYYDNVRKFPEIQERLDAYTQELKNLMGLKVYVSNVDTFSPAVPFLLNANKIPFESVTINLYKGDQNSAEYKKINPLGKVPGLAEGDFTLFESPTILRYICNSKSVDDHWYPKDPVKRSIIDLYFDWHGPNVTIINKACFHQFQNKPQSEIDEAKKEGEVARKQLEDVFLSKRKYVATNDEISIGDLALIWHLLMGVICGNQLSPRLKEYYDNVKTFPGVQDKLDTYERDLKAMMGRMAAAKQQSGEKSPGKKSTTPTK